MKRIASFRIVALIWLAVCAAGTLPYIITGTLAPVDALFESVSGFTTTGLSVISDVESLPKPLLLWQSLTYWVGGMGVLALLFAVLPYLDGHPAQLMQTETPGPVKGKLVSKSRDTARILYSIYISITVLLFILLCAGGMNIFDSVVHAFSTVGTGGFSSRNSNLMSFDSAYFEVVITIFMMISSVNFNFFYLLILKRARDIVKSEEIRWLFIIYGVSVFIILTNISQHYQSIATALKHAAFHAASTMSTTGFYYTDFTKWPMAAQSVLVVLMFVGGSAGSTSGGFKVSRLIILVKSMKRGLKQIIFPNLVEVVRLDSKSIDETSIRGTQTYFTVYIFILFISVFLLSFDKYTFDTNFMTVITAFNNVGLAWGELTAAESITGFSGLSKIILIIDMLLGRLEIFPFLLAFSYNRRNSK